MQYYSCSYMQYYSCSYMQYGTTAAGIESGPQGPLSYQSICLDPGPHTAAETPMFLFASAMHALSR